MDNIEKNRLRDALRKSIKDSDPEKNGIPDYPFSEKPGFGRFYRFDLVELNINESIEKLYVFCSYDEYQVHLNALLKQLRHYQRITHAEVFLAFIENRAVKILPLREVEDEVIKNNESLNLIKSFTEYYTSIRKQILYPIGREMLYSSFFRGQPNNLFEPIPGIYRDDNIGSESRIYHEAIRRLPNEFTEDMSTFDKLVKMQHYELPTRLLDVTTNPLVALYFACQESKKSDGTEADGEVLIYRIFRDDIKFYDSDSVCILSNLAKRGYTFYFESEKDHLVYDINKEKAGFDGKLLKREALNRVLCVLPKLNNDRIIKQDGAFFIFGMGERKREPASIPVLPYIINIEASAKREILEELEFLGITESSLFPETDRIMKQIKNLPPALSDFRQSTFHSLIENGVIRRI